MSNRGIIINKSNQSQIWNDFSNTSFGINNGTSSVVVGFSDIFYLPNSKFKNFHFLSSLMNQFEIFIGKLLN